MGQAALQAHCYAGRRRGAAAGGSGRQRHDQGAPAGVMLWAVPGVPLQCPTHPASLRDTAGGLWDRQRCKRIATQAAGGAPLQGGPAGSGAARNACRCDAVGCARGASAVPHPPRLTEGHCRRVVGQAALQAHCYAGRRRGAAAGGSGRQRHDQGAPAGGMLWAVPGVPLQCPTHPASLRDTAGGLWDRQRCKRIATQAAGGAPLSEAGWVGHCRGTPGTAHSITPAGAPWSCRCLPDPPAAAPLLRPA